MTGVQHRWMHNTWEPSGHQLPQAEAKEGPHYGSTHHQLSWEPPLEKLAICWREKTRFRKTMWIIDDQERMEEEKSLALNPRKTHHNEWCRHWFAGSPKVHVAPAYLPLCAKSWDPDTEWPHLGGVQIPISESDTRSKTKGTLVGTQEQW